MLQYKEIFCKNIDKNTKKTYKSLKDLKNKLELDGYDILNESYSTLDVIDAYESDGIVVTLVFYVQHEEIKVCGIE